MKKLTLQEMTAAEQFDVKTKLDRARISMGRALSNSEQNKIKNDAIDIIMVAREKIAKANRVERKVKKTTTNTTTFNWSSSISTRPPR